ncbi:MAG: hypothetical protein WCJ21_12885, partial [Planctomycetota bacterium]
MTTRFERVARNSGLQVGQPAVARVSRAARIGRVALAAVLLLAGPIAPRDCSAHGGGGGHG